MACGSDEVHCFTGSIWKDMLLEARRHHVLDSSEGCRIRGLPILT